MLGKPLLAAMWPSLGLSGVSVVEAAIQVASVRAKPGARAALRVAGEVVHPRIGGTVVLDDRVATARTLPCTKLTSGHGHTAPGRFKRISVDVAQHRVQHGLVADGGKTGVLPLGRVRLHLRAETTLVLRDCLALKRRRGAITEGLERGLSLLLNGGEALAFGIGDDGRGAGVEVGNLPAKIVGFGATDGGVIGLGLVLVLVLVVRVLALVLVLVFVFVRVLAVFDVAFLLALRLRITPSVLAGVGLLLVLVLVLVLVFVGVLAASVLAGVGLLLL